MSEPALQQMFRRSERIVTRRIAGECVLVPLASRGVDVTAMYNLNPTAAFVWDQLEGDVAGEAIVAAMVARFEVDEATAREDYLRLMATLEELGAVARAQPARREGLG